MQGTSQPEHQVSRTSPSGPDPFPEGSTAEQPALNLFVTCSVAGRPVVSQARAQLRAVSRPLLAAAVGSSDQRACKIWAPVQARKSLHVTAASKSQLGRWKGMDEDMSDDQVSAVFSILSL